MGRVNPNGVVLTFRQRQVLQLAADGRTNRWIGERLHVGAGTVGRTFARTLGARNRPQAVAIRLRLGLIR
jgi:DNA-binding CsgD family transcriptional regulator